MTAISEYFAMGGYAGYIWSSYGVTALVMLVLLITSLRMLRGNEATYKKLAPAEPENNEDETVEKKT